MKRLRLVILALAIVVGLPLLLGSLLPREHVASTRLTLSASPEDAWDAITDLGGMAAWRSGVESVERLPDQDGHVVYREHTGFGPLTLEVVDSKRPTLYRTRVADPDLPFGGTWTWRVEPAGAGCTVTVTEDGFVKNAFFRFWARYLSGYHGTQEHFLGDLAGKFGEEPRLERVE